MTETALYIPDIDAPNALPEKVADMHGFKQIAKLAGDVIEKQFGIDKTTIMREVGFAVQQVEKNKDILKTDPKSVFNAIVNVGAIGLTLNPAMKFAWLIPRKDRGDYLTSLNPSYMGLIKLCTDPGGVLVMNGGVVWEGDEYEYQQGTGGFLKIHRNLSLEPRSKLSSDEKGLVKKREAAPWEACVMAYSVAQLHNGAVDFDAMGVDRLHKIYKKCVKFKGDNAPAVVWTDEFMRKTVLAHHTKTLPKSERVAMAVQLFHEAEGFAFEEKEAGSSMKEDLSKVKSVNCSVCLGDLGEDGCCHASSCPEGVPE